MRAEFIGRGKYQILPETTGVDALLTGEVTSVDMTPVSFTAQQLASRYAITMTARDRAARHAREQGAVGEPERDVPPGVRSDERHQTRIDPAAFFGQDANALDRMSTEFARTIVSAILEAF